MWLFPSKKACCYLQQQTVMRIVSDFPEGDQVQYLVICRAFPTAKQDFPYTLYQ
jgi:hypothetical protein